MFQIKIINTFILIIILCFFYFNKKDPIKVNQNDLIKYETKISVIIAVYNGGKYLNYSLRSVQNQKMKDIEIIIIDDNSKDDSLKIIKNYMKNDKRIKLIQNKENRKILFSKSLGALNSKGKYIIELDQDDMFIRDDAFDIIYKESEKYELDLLHFDFISGNNILELPKIKNCVIIRKIFEKQPKLKSTIFKTNICLLWGNLIRSDLYKKVIYYLWPIIMNYKIIFQEDFLITFFILIYSKKFEKISNKLYFYLVNIKSASNDHKNNSEYYLSVIFAGIIFFDYYIDFYPQDIQILVNYIIFLKDDFKKIKILFPTIFNYFFGKIYSNEKLTKHLKNLLSKDFYISENYDSYLFLYENQSFYLSSLPSNKTNIIKQIDQLMKLSIIINSINGQNCADLEIILIYDNEDKNDYNLLYNYINSYYNIKLIDNEIKKGAISSISEGVMIAKGEYLLILNQNCFFISNDTIPNIFRELQEKYIDIFEFNLYKILQNNYINIYKCKHFVSQLNLTKIKYNLEYNDIDINKELLTNKIFRNGYFKNIIKLFKLDKIKEVIDYYYNNIISFIIENTKHEFRHINSISLYIQDVDVDKPKFNDFIPEEKKRVNETIFYFNFIYDNSNNTYESKEKVLKEFFNYMSIIYNKFTKISKESVKLINKFIYSEYISKENKNLLKFYYDSLIT